MLTVCTAGLWGVSWLAIVLGHTLWPWRCKACGCSAPDLTRKQPTTAALPAIASGMAMPTALATPSDMGTPSGITPPKVALPTASSIPLPEPEAMHAA